MAAMDNSNNCSNSSSTTKTTIILNESEITVIDEENGYSNKNNSHLEFINCDNNNEIKFNQKFNNVNNHNTQSIGACSFQYNDNVDGNLKAKTNFNGHNDENFDDKLINTYERLSQWIHCIAVVHFDIEVGQSIEVMNDIVSVLKSKLDLLQCIVPKNVYLTEKEISNICYLSFPDSNSGCMGDTQFYFRTKCCPIKRKNYEQFYKEFNSKCLPILASEQSYFYGFVYFRQVKDRNARRGYFQKSLVILTWFPFVSLFSHLIKILAPQYFDYGLPVLEAACSDINRWPKPATDQTINLPFIGTITQIIIPGEKQTASTMCQIINQQNRYSSPTLSLFKLTNKRNKLSINHQSESSSSIENTDSLNAKNSQKFKIGNDINLYRTLLPVIAHIQLLWELVLTNEPIAVITQTPNVCSEIVTALVNLIAPLRYGADYRPFFTIHDSEFKEYTSHTKSPPPVILGVTNPFFVKTLQDWPHLIKINETTASKNSIKMIAIDTLQKINPNKSLEMKTGVYTKYKPFLQKDREILKKILKGMETNRPSEVQNVILNRFLLELTHSFAIPLERYFASLMPLAKNLSPFKQPPIMKHFKIEDFINRLDTTGPHLTSLVKGDWIGLYRRFLRSPNFVHWYHSRTNEANNKILSLHLETVGDTNLATFLNDKPEVELVDLILRLKENLKCAVNNRLRISSETEQKIQENIAKIIDKLPEDSRQLFENFDQHNDEWNGDSKPNSVNTVIN